MHPHSVRKIFATWNSPHSSCVLKRDLTLRRGKSIFKSMKPWGRCEQRWQQRREHWRWWRKRLLAAYDAKRRIGSSNWSCREKLSKVEANVCLWGKGPLDGVWRWVNSAIRCQRTDKWPAQPDARRVPVWRSTSWAKRKNSTQWP